MNYTELLDELFARGTNYLEDSAAETARAGRWINQAYREILNLHAWPFLRATATGADGVGFVSIPDLRRIRFVTDVEGTDGLVPGQPLERATEDDLVNQGLDLSTTGSPEVYYTMNGTVYTYPLGGTIRVDYIKRVSPMSGTDSPLFLEEYHDLIVDRAMMKAYKDSDNFEAAAALRLEFDAGLSAMAEDYMLDSKEVTFLAPTGDDT